MDYKDNQNKDGGESFSNVQQDWTQQNMPQKPVVINELQHKKDNMVAMSLALGILGILLCWVECYSVVICMIGLIMGIVGAVRTKQNRGVAVAGIITSAIGLAASAVFNLIYLLVQL